MTSVQERSNYGSFAVVVRYDANLDINYVHRVVAKSRESPVWQKDLHRRRTRKMAKSTTRHYMRLPSE